MSLIFKKFMEEAYKFDMSELIASKLSFSFKTDFNFAHNHINQTVCFIF